MAYDEALAERVAGLTALRTDAQLTKWLDLALDYNPRAPQSRRKKTSSR